MLNIEKVVEIIQPEGLLSNVLKGFEARQSQIEMLRNILEAYHQDAIALIEAGTGTGKSIAYLIPAILWAVETKERTLISTNTITLQEQLINKDIPLLLNALKVDVKAVLVKGMNNYICLRKLEDANQELRLLPYEEAEELDRLEAWKASTKDGSRSDLPFVPSATTWERVGAESDTCNHQQCPHYKECFFMKARKKAGDAQILVANHHMLFSDLAVRAEKNNYKDPCILPPYSRIVIDEAHHIEDVATDYFASRVSHLGILRILSRIASEKQGKALGKLPQIKEKLLQHYGPQPTSDVSKIASKLNIDLHGYRNELLIQVTNSFQAFAAFANLMQKDKKQSAKNELEVQPGESKLRMLPYFKTHPHWNQDIVPHVKLLVEAIKRYVQSINGLEVDLLSLKNERFQEQTKGIRYDMTAYAGRLEASSNTLEEFVNEKEELSSVRWMETQAFRSQSNIHLVNADLDVASRLANFLFSKFPTLILCSATLATNKDFSFVKKRLGITSERLPNKKIIEHIYDSPFNYHQQALFAIPTDVPYPLDPTFTEVASERIWQALQASKGNAFILFTSYSMLKTCHQLLEKRLAEHRYVSLKQGDDNRASLLHKFKTTDRSVLFGTDSFWEGVDVVGDALRCVIIVKLPFKVPSEPIIQARTEAIILQGGDPFFEYSLPNAIVKFKQGFGRLIRNKRDRGCIICLDTRLINKGYGQQFLNSLPGCQFLFAESAIMQQQMTDFYKKTYHLVGNK